MAQAKLHNINISSILQASTSFKTSGHTMASNYSILLLVLALSAPLAVLAGDPDILTDFVVPPNVNPMNITGDFFTYTGFRSAINMTMPMPMPTFMVTKASMKEFPALNGQSVSYALLMYPPGSVNPTHTHPRSAELLLVVDGALSVGFVDTTNKLYTQDLAAGDMFVFPKGMVHFQFNNGTAMARAFSAFGSASPGTISLPGTLFETGIEDAVLQKSFRTDQSTVDALKHDLAPAPAPGPATPPPSSSAATLLSRSALMLLCFAAAFLL